jgi:hypothetical protein
VGIPENDYGRVGQRGTEIHFSAKAVFYRERIGGWRVIA